MKIKRMGAGFVKLPNDSLIFGSSQIGHWLRKAFWFMNKKPKDTI